MRYFDGPNHEIMASYEGDSITVLKKTGTFSSLVSTIHDPELAIDTAKKVLFDNEFQEFLRLRFLRT